jgi:hypothetical protein
MNRTLVVGALLAGSVAANLYQWRTRGSGAKAAGAGAAAPAAPSASESPQVITRTRTEPKPVARDGKALPTMAATCPGQLAAVTKELAETQQKLEERLTFAEKFERSSPAPEAEERVRAAVDKVFASAPKGYGYTAECRGEVCQVDVTAPDKGDWDWSEALQREAYHAIGAGHAMYGGKPGQDPITKEPIMLHKTLVQLQDTAAADGLAILAAAYQTFSTGEARNRCTAADPTRGYLVVALHLDSTDRRITYDAGGTLPATALGRCLLAALDATLAATPIPERVRGAVLYQTLEI